MSQRDQLPCVITVRTNDTNGATQTNQFTLCEQIGRGGMGVVYKAIDHNPPEWYKLMYTKDRPPRYVAVKYLRERPKDDVVLQRFFREAEVAHKIDHPNVVRVHGLYKDDEGYVLIVMRLIQQARTLTDLLEACKKRAQRHPITHKVVGSVVPLPTLLPLLHQMLDALEALHAASIVHRDLKLENFLLGDEGDGPHIYLTDFGIAKSLDPECSAGVPLTSQHSLLGTPFYMAPEQILHKMFRQREDGDPEPWGICVQTDIWAFGAIVYELLTAQFPYYAEKQVMDAQGNICTEYDYASVVGQITDKEFSPRPITQFVSEAHPALTKLIESCLRREPWNRPNSIAEVRGLLDAAGLAPPSVRSRPAIFTERLPMPTAAIPDQQIQEKPAGLGWHRSWSFGLVGLACVLGLVGWFYWRAERPLASVVPVVVVSSQPLVSASVAPIPVPAVPASVSTASPLKRKAGLGPEPDTLAERNYKQALNLKARGRYRLAEEELHLVLAQYPDYPPPFRLIAECALVRRDQRLAQSYAQAYLNFETSREEDLSPGLRQLLSRAK